jgi:signal transduction histidine kinase
MLRGDNGVERQARLIKRGVSRMQSLIEDLLLLSRLDASTTGGRCDPKTVAAELHEEIVGRFEDAGARLYLSLEPAEVHCTDGLLRQVLANLVENAFKYRRGEVAAEIAVTGRLVARGYEIRVADNGIGMSSDELGHAFDPLYRARRVPDVPGTGLGLSIVKRVIERYGGSIGIASQLGRGSTVTLILPMNPAPSES